MCALGMQVFVSVRGVDKFVHCVGRGRIEYGGAKRAMAAASLSRVKAMHRRTSRAIQIDFRERRLCQCHAQAVGAFAESLSSWG